MSARLRPAEAVAHAPGSFRDDDARLAGAPIVSVQSVARQYAHALFDVARKRQLVDAVGRDLAAIAELTRSHAGLNAAFTAPGVPAARKRALVDALLARDGSIQTEVQRLFQLLADRDRLGIVAEINEAYQARALQASQVVPAEVISAEPLGEAGKSALAGALGRALGRTVMIEERVDPSILGGFVAKVGGVVFDASIARQIERMRQRLLAQG
jgi:F-type H+-transporting ATPase subunit delta